MEVFPQILSDADYFQIVYCLKIFDGILYSGSGDKSVRLWDVRVRYNSRDLNNEFFRIWLSNN